MKTPPTRLTILTFAAASLTCAAHAGEVEAETFERHKVELDVAITHTERDDALSLSVSYGYRFDARASIGALAEYAFDPVEASVLGMPLRLYPAYGLVLAVMSGGEVHHSETEALFRAGVGYEFQVSRASATPEVNVDFVDGETNVGGGVSPSLVF